MKTAVVTVSDSVAQGVRADASGDAIAAWVGARGDRLHCRIAVPDDVVEIVRALLGACDHDGCDLVVTTGGTGLSSRDVTPEATRAVLDSEAPGIADLLRAKQAAFPRAALSRGVAGVRGRTLIVNLPGSPGGVRDGLAMLDTVIDHAHDVMSGRVTQHGGND